MNKLVLYLLICTPFFSYGQTDHLSVESIWAVRDSLGVYKIEAKDNLKWKLYKGASVNTINWNEKIATLKGKTVFQSSDLANRLYFAAIYKKDTVYFSERRLIMAGAPNFRDLGGLKTNDGRTVKWGKLFRCGDMGQLTEGDLQIIKNSGITDVVDFRNESEIEKSPDRYPSGYNMNRIQAKIGQADGKEMGKFMQIVTDPSATGDQVEKIFAGFYSGMALGAKDYQPLFDELVVNSGDEALLFHCTAGKDRTGLASALILSALNVPEETIIEEYYLSNLYTKSTLTKSSMMKGLKPEVAEALSGVKPIYIQASLKSIKDKYGSIKNMLEKELGLTEVERRDLISKYTY